MNLQAGFVDVMYVWFLVESPSEEPLEPRHLPPQVRHRMDADLQVHEEKYLNLTPKWDIDIVS